MQITSKGQVTIPVEVRNRLGLLPHTEVEFELVGDHAVLRKFPGKRGIRSRGLRAVEALQGRSDVGLSTDEIMALTRGENEGRGKRV